MNKHIQIRDIDAATHKDLVRKAEAEGLSLSEYLRQLLKNVSQHKSNAQIIAEIRKRGPVSMDVSAAELVRQGRDER
jgi:two-component sensor histidine kinase